MKHKNEENTCVLISNEDSSVALWAKKINENEYAIYDKEESLYKEILTKKSFLNFLDGKLEITDIFGHPWNFSKQPENQKVSISNLFHFINQQ